jgi:DNA primase
MGWVDDFVAFSKGNLDDRVLESLYFRGVSQEQVNLFQIGYINKVLPDTQIPKSFLTQFNEGAKLEDSYVFPLTNPLGEILGFQFRAVERESKQYSDYLMTDAEPVLFGLGQSMPHIWTLESACVVEGAFDFFPVQRVLPYTIATITSKIRDNLLRWLIRLVRRLYMFYDNDSPGLRANSDFLNEHGSKLELVKILEYPRGVTLPGTKKLVKDPGDLWEAWGDDKLGPFLLEQILE